MKKNILIKALFIIILVLLYLFSSGCGDTYRYVPEEGITYHTEDNILIHLCPYTDSLDNKYRFGRDFTFLSLNNAFLLSVTNKSDKVVDFYPAMKAVLVDNFGNQYKVVQNPELPSLETLHPKYRYDLSYNSFNDEVSVDDIDDDLEELYERELYLRGQISYDSDIQQNIATRDIRDSLISLERELLSVERRLVEAKREKLVKDIKAKKYKDALFKDGLIYPGATISGLLVFDNQIVKKDNYVVDIMFPYPDDNKKIFSFKFDLERVTK